MSHTSKIFTSQKVDIPNRSGFDMSFENFLTMKVGTLTPVLCEEVLPNETYDLGFLGQVQLPPMATDFYGRVDLRLEAFFVPNRIVWGGWQDFMTMPVNNPFSPSPVRPSSVPYLKFTGNADNQSEKWFGKGTLADYLGFKITVPASGSSFAMSIPNLLPFLAYHKIYDDWYRNSKIQRPLFVKANSGASTTDQAKLKSMPYQSLTTNLFNNPNSMLLNDSSNLFELHQRNWAKDYFTTAALYPQASGDTTGSTVEVDGDSNKFSIGALRAANTLQRWMDRNNVAGERYADQIKATFGCYPSDSTTDRAIFLGSESIGIYNKSVFTTAESSEGSNNPFSGSVGSKAANAQAVGDGKLIDSFKTTEHGYIMVIASIVPHATYGTGTRRQLLHHQISDFANPLLQGLGEQAIYTAELSDTLVSDPIDKGNIFGYQQQYSEYKYHDDEVHGLLRDGGNLETFALQRSFGNASTIGLNTAFVQIPTTYMDQVTSVSSTLSEYGAWANFFFSFKKVSPLSEYVIPTLGDLKDTHTEEIPYRGTML